MRLLNVATKKLETFYGDNIPRYAILSHMWGEEEDEVLFKHVAGSNYDRCEGEKRRGYAKLTAACEQAIKDGWEYIWIDTCCIDKQSSAELSEAINSMYEWYGKSEVCYAYLEDVGIDRGARGFRFGTVPFGKSRWFTRGWTLQELIAPRRVVFYSSDWIDIGTKASLRDVISSVTDIRVEMITNYDPDKASVAERMSWAAKRQTTRLEDIAYCLMGLLGVNMPLLYGEGKRAFRRLQEEIMKDSDDHSIFAWRTDCRRYSDHLELLKVTRGMLADSPSDYLGAGNVIRSNVEGPYSAYSMGNRGLQIGLPIRPIDFELEPILMKSNDSQNIFQAILDCTYRDTSPTRWVVIYLKMVEKGRYVRIFPYWLDETQMNPNEAGGYGWAVTPLLVPQVNTSTTSPIGLYDLGLKILPTNSGYTHKSKNLLVKGWDYKPPSGMVGYSLGDETWNFEAVNVFIFDREGRSFGVVIGIDKGLLWMDIIKEVEFEKLSLTSEHDNINKIKALYNEGGPRYQIRQHFNLLCMNVSKDHSVEVSSLRKPYRGFGFVPTSGYMVTICVDIRRITIQIPPPMDINDDFPDNLDPRNVHLSSKKEGADWFAIFNTKVKKAVDVGPVHAFMDNDPHIVLFSPNGEYFATAAHSTVQIYNTTTGDTICILNSKSIRNLNVGCMCFSPDGKFLAIDTYDGHILIWDITNNYVHHDFTSHQWGIQVLKFSLDSRVIISVPRHGIVRVFDITNGTSEDVCDLGYKHSSSAAISPNNRFFARARDADIQIWDLQTKQLVGVLQGHDHCVNSITFTPDGKGLVSGSDDKTLKYWDIGRSTVSGIKWRELSNVIGPVNSSGAPGVSVGRDMDGSSQCIMNIRHKHAISSVAVTNEGRWIISLSNDCVHFWDSRDGTMQFTLRNRIVNSVFLFDISPTGNIFATYTGQNRVQLWKYDSVEPMD